MHFNYVEIGSNYFGTLADKLPGPGLMLEPIPEYFHLIPDRFDLIKRCVALDIQPVSRDMYYWPRESIREGEECLQGCGSFLENHAMVDENTTITRHRTTVPCITWADLINIYSIRSIGYLKLDCEGYDCVLLNELLRIKPPNLRIDTIQFETNANTSAYDVSATIKNLRQHGYVIVLTGHDTIMKLQDVPVL